VFNLISRNNVGAIVGGILGCVIVIGVIVTIIIVITCQKKQRQVGVVFVPTQQVYGMSVFDVVVSFSFRNMSS